MWSIEVFPLDTVLRTGDHFPFLSVINYLEQLSNYTGPHGLLFPDNLMLHSKLIDTKKYFMFIKINEKEH